LKYQIKVHGVRCNYYFGLRGGYKECVKNKNMLVGELEAYSTYLKMLNAVAVVEEPLSPKSCNSNDQQTTYDKETKKSRRAR
jgi:hypothetical protein